MRFFPALNTFSASVVSTTRIRTLGLAPIITEHDDRAARLSARAGHAPCGARLPVCLPTSFPASSRCQRRLLSSTLPALLPALLYCAQAYERFVAENGIKQVTDPRTWARMSKSARDVINKSFGSGIQQARAQQQGLSAASPIRLRLFFLPTRS